MKTIKILIISLLLVTTQAFAWGKSEQKALLGFTAGVVLTHLVSNYDNNSCRSRSTQTVYTEEPREIVKETVYVKEPKEIVYINRYPRHREFRHFSRHHHNRDRWEHSHYDRRYGREYNERYTQHHRKHHKVVVQNNYTENYYY